MKSNREIKTKAAIAGLLILWVTIPLLLYAYYEYIDDRYRQNHPTHEYEVTFINNMDHGYLWIDSNVVTHVWRENCDASCGPEEVILGTISLDAKESGSGFALPYLNSSKGTVTLPADFQLNKYIRNNNKVVFAVRVLINEVYEGHDNFVAESEPKRSNGFFTVKLRENPDFSKMLFDYPIEWELANGSE